MDPIIIASIVASEKRLGVTYERMEMQRLRTMGIKYLLST